jgi:hypothetical protein
VYIAIPLVDVGNPFSRRRREISIRNYASRLIGELIKNVEIVIENIEVLILPSYAPIVDY